MNHRILFAANGIINVLAGAALFILPSLCLHFFGTTEDYGSTLLATRFFGAALLTAGLLLWFAKDMNDTETLKNLSYAGLAGAVAGLIVTIIGTSSGTEAVIREKAWIPLVLTVVFGLGYAFMLFIAPKMQTSTN